MSSCSEKYNTWASHNHRFHFTMSEMSPAEASVKGPGSGVSQGEPPVVHLRVGEKLFNATAHTLSKESTYFRSLVSGQHQQPTDGAFFVDADPDLFAYVLRYLRHGIYPVCFSPDSGHDYATYSGITRLAEQFGIERLTRWLVDRQYESAIECSLSIGWVRLGDASVSHPSAERMYCLGPPDGYGSVCVFKRSFTARPEAFLTQDRGNA